MGYATAGDLYFTPYMAMIKAPLRPGTRLSTRWSALHRARRVEETRQPTGLNSPPPLRPSGPRPQDRRGGVRVREAPFKSAQ
jgi:hypothetical protein